MQKESTQIRSLLQKQDKQDSRYFRKIITLESENKL